MAGPRCSSRSSSGDCSRSADATDEELPRALGVTCPAMLYPYVRETVTTLSVRGGFPPFIMQPADFEEIYRRQQAEAREPAN